MKQFIVIIFIATLSFSLNAQKLVENKIDEFTKHTVKRTSWEDLLYSMKGNAYFRISKINDSYFFDLKYADGTVFSIDKNAELMLKLDNDSIFKLTNLEFTITSNGAGAIGLAGSNREGISVSYVSFNDPKFITLINHKVKKFRINTTSGYIEDEVKPKFAEKIVTAVKLVN